VGKQGIDQKIPAMGQEDQELLIRGGSKHPSAEHLNNVSIIHISLGTAIATSNSLQRENGGPQKFKTAIAQGNIT